MSKIILFQGVSIHFKGYIGVSGCFNMFLDVSGCFKVFLDVSRGFKGIQVYFPIYSTMGRIVGLIVSDVFLLYLEYRYKIGKIWL